MGVSIDPNKTESLFENAYYVAGEGLLSAVAIPLHTPYTRLRMDISLVGLCGNVYLNFNDDLINSHYVTHVIQCVLATKAAYTTVGGPGVSLIFQHYRTEPTTGTAGKCITVDIDLLSGVRRQVHASATYADNTNKVAAQSGSGQWTNTADAVTSIGFVTNDPVSVKYSIFVRGCF